MVSEWRLKLVYKEMEDLKNENQKPEAHFNLAMQSLQSNLSQEIDKISEKLKSTEEKLEAKTATLNQVLQVQQENLASLNQSVASEVTKAVSSQVEKMEMKVEMLSLKFSEGKALLDLERKDRELIQSKCANQIENLSLAMELKVGKLEQENEKLKQEIIDLKKESLKIAKML
jgi:hypothetical protein